jgi:hypothetical protein
MSGTERMSKTWLYAASDAKASAGMTFELAARTGFVWRSFYTRGARPQPIGNVRYLSPGDVLLLGYREGGGRVRLLGRFHLGRPDAPLCESPVFGRIPEVSVPDFRRNGYEEDPCLAAMVGIFVEEAEPAEGMVLYGGRGSIVEYDEGMTRTFPSPPMSRAPIPSVRHASPARVPAPTPAAVSRSRAASGSHVGVDVGGRPDKGFDLCFTQWEQGVLIDLRFASLPHTAPLPPTAKLRGLVARGDLAGLAEVTYPSASRTAAALWSALRDPAGVYIDSPSSFSRNTSGHGRLCEKTSMTGVTFQSTPSIRVGKEHGGDWGWLLYGMVAFAACVHRGRLTHEAWFQALEGGLHTEGMQQPFLLRECFPTATISALRTHGRAADVRQLISGLCSAPEPGAVARYLQDGVRAVKQPWNSLYDRADALLAALTCLPHVHEGFREVEGWPHDSTRWSAAPAEGRVEGTFVYPR